MSKPVVSIIIPVRAATLYLNETIACLKKQTFKNFELIVVTDEKENIPNAKVFASGEPGPAYKRNLGCQMARGQILAFLDDDSYPSSHWLEKAVEIFQEDRDIAAVCGPTLTPSTDNLYQKASGWVWASWFGSGGAGSYRNRVETRREVDDFPSVNLLVKKNDFEKVGGFDIAHWPGEDTKLCLDLTKKLGKKIIYDPKVLVYHHRRSIFLSHLKQISRYGLRRGFFARKFPETSFRIGYLLPSVLVLGLFISLSLSFILPLFRPLLLLISVLYFSFLIAAGVEIFLKEKNIYLAFLVVLAISLTHFLYGCLFIWGYFKKNVGVIPHSVDREKNEYIGG